MHNIKIDVSDFFLDLNQDHDFIVFNKIQNIFKKDKTITNFNELINKLEHIEILEFVDLFEKKTVFSDSEILLSCLYILGIEKNQDKPLITKNEINYVLENLEIYVRLEKSYRAGHIKFDSGSKPVFNLFIRDIHSMRYTYTDAGKEYETTKKLNDLSNLFSGMGGGMKF